MTKYLTALAIAAFSLVTLTACGVPPQDEQPTQNTVYENSIDEPAACEEAGKRDEQGRPIPLC